MCAETQFTKLSFLCAVVALPTAKDPEGVVSVERELGWASGSSFVIEYWTFGISAAAAVCCSRARGYCSVFCCASHNSPGGCVMMMLCVEVCVGRFKERNIFPEDVCMPASVLPLQ